MLFEALGGDLDFPERKVFKSGAFQEQVAIWFVLCNLIVYLRIFGKLRPDWAGLDVQVRHCVRPDDYKPLDFLYLNRVS